MVNAEVIEKLSFGDMLVVRIPAEQRRDRLFMAELVEGIQRQLQTVGLTNKVILALCGTEWDLERIDAARAKTLLTSILRREGEVDAEYKRGWGDGALATAIGAEVAIKAIEVGDDWPDIGYGAILELIAEKVVPAQLHER